MPREFINAKNSLTTPTYHQAVKVGNTIYLAGMVGLDAEGRSSPDVAVQIERAYENVKATLAATGATMEDLVTTRVYLTRTEDIPVHREIRQRYLTDPATPYTQIIVKALGREDLLVEIETVAVVDG